MFDPHLTLLFHIDRHTKFWIRSDNAVFAKIAAPWDSFAKQYRWQDACLSLLLSSNTIPDCVDNKSTAVSAKIATS